MSQSSTVLQLDQRDVRHQDGHLVPDRVQSPIEPSGARAFKINGVPIVIRGGGFDPNLFLHYSAADTAKQIALMKNMGVNTIRLEGHIMPADFFEQMDAAGILVNAGFQCCDAWEVQRQRLTQAQLTVICRTRR